MNQTIFNKADVWNYVEPNKYYTESLLNVTKAFKYGASIEIIIV